MLRWEYHSIIYEMPRDWYYLDDKLDKLGQEGWECFQVMEEKDTGNFIFFFKRPI